jgi:hypothetical protein
LPWAQLLSLCFILSALVSIRFDAAAQSDPGGAMTNAVVAAGQAARAEALKRTALEAKAQPANASAPSASDTPPPPITDANASKGGFEGAPLTYSIDLSAMIMGGKTYQVNDLPGGMDASLIYKIDRTTRIGAAYYQFSADPLGADDSIPVVFQGTHTAIGTVNGAAAGINSITHLRFEVLTANQMFFVGGRHHPLVLVPAYAAIRSSIGGGGDVGPIFANGQFLTVHQRSYETKAINLEIPLFYGEKYLIAYAGGATWNVNSNGANLTNHMQYVQTGFMQYQPDQTLTAFAEIIGQKLYFPTDSYPYNTPEFHYGISKIIRAPFFVEAEVSTGGPSNPNYAGQPGRIGIQELVVPCSRTAAGGGPTLSCVALAQNGVAVPVVGAQRFTTFSVMFGIGANPLVRPF